MDRPIRVLVIDDSAFNRRTITRLLESTPGVEVVGAASDGMEGLKEALRLKPDLITLDLEMPRMDGFTFLRAIMETNPIPVIVVSGRKGDVDVFKALELGAIDFISKPTRVASHELFNIKDELLSKIALLPHLRLRRTQRVDNLPPPLEEGGREISSSAGEVEHPIIPESEIDVVAIGASTGGPPALSQILSQLSEDLPASLVVSQHMPPGFTRAFAERLNKVSRLKVREARDGEVVRRGEVLITPGGHHLTFRKEGRRVVTRLREGKDGERYVPSVDIMFTSVADIWGEKALGVVLTGMGSDGRDGVLRIKDRGGYVLTESEETCVVFGMPEVAISTGRVDEVLSLYDIGQRINEYCRKGLVTQPSGLPWMK